jgi:hypothetical protein
VDVDHGVTGFNGGIARNVPGRLTVPDDIEEIGPDLWWLHARMQVKERTTQWRRR